MGNFERYSDCRIKINLTMYSSSVSETYHLRQYAQVPSLKRNNIARCSKNECSTSHQNCRSLRSCPKEFSLHKTWFVPQYLKSPRIKTKHFPNIDNAQF